MMPIRSPLRVLLVALLLGWAADFLFYGKALGISVLLFVGLGLGTLVGLARLEDVAPVRRNLWLALPLLFFAAMVAVRDNLFLTLLNLLATGGLGLLLASYYAAERVEQISLFGYPLALLRALGNAVVQAPPLVIVSVDLGTLPRRSNRHMAPVFRGSLLALPVLIVFTYLLSSADLVFARYVEDLTHLQFLSSVPELGFRLLLILGVAWGVAGLLAYTLDRRNAVEEAATKTRPLLTPARPRTVGIGEAATVLVVIDALFAVFVWIQFEYLFRGPTLATLADSAYKHYARQGFGELVAVSLLTLALILGLRWLARGGTPAQMRLFNLLSSLLIGLTLVILLSAWSRMFYWEEVADYIATALRLYVRVAIIWLALLFGWLLLTMWLRPNRFAIGAFVAALGFLATLDVINPDADAVRYNVARAQVTHEIYAPYLTELSDDAVPALVAALDQLPDSISSGLAYGFAKDVIRTNLRARLSRLEAAQIHAPWPSFHLGRAQAYDLLNQNRDKLLADSRH